MDQQSTNYTNANQVSVLQKKMALDAKVRNGISWFYLIGILSMLNSVLLILGSNLTFVVGLAITQVVDGISTGMAQALSGSLGSFVRVMGLCLDMTIAGLFIGAGYLGNKRHKWAIYAGLVVYILDAFIFVAFSEWLAVVFHGLGIYGVINGLIALKKLEEFEKSDDMKFIPPITIDPKEQEEKRKKRKTYFWFFGIYGTLMMAYLIYMLVK